MYLIYIFFLFAVVHAEKRSLYECNSTQIFNPVILKCTDCGGSKLVPNSEKTECVCANGYVNLSPNQKIDRSQQQQQCIRCADYGLTINYDNEFCVQCPQDGKQKNNTQRCQACRENEIIVYDYSARMVNNSKSGLEQVPTQRCMACPLGKISDAQKRICVDCQDTTCYCKSVNKSAMYCDTSETRGVDADTIILSDSSNRRIIIDYLARKTVMAASKCRGGERQACQHLANLCVLSDFSRNAIGSACYYFDDIKRTSYGNQFIVPNLFYANIDASAELYRENAIDGIFRFNTATKNLPTRSNNRIDIFAAAYSINGSFLGLLDVNDDTLNICYKSQHAHSFKLGRVFRGVCELSVEQILQWNNGLVSRKFGISIQDKEETTIFYELYLRYNSPSGEKKIYQIPIINENLRDNYLNYINRNINEVRRNSQVVIVRRFFITDEKEGKAVDALKRVVRVPESISLSIQFQSSKDSKIFPPYLQIRYRHITSDNDTLENQRIGTEFSIKYTMDSFRYEKFLEVTMGSLCSLSLLFGLVKAYSWARRAGRLMIDTATIVKFVLYTCENISNVFFIVMTITAVWLTYTYKFQEDIILCPLSYEQETSFTIYIITAAILNTIVLLHNYVTLMMVETFFIDWERPRFAIEQCRDPLQQSNIELSASSATKLPRKHNPVVIWRTYLVANEWNELQGYRKTSVTLQLLSLLFFLEFLHFGDWAIIQPGFERYDEPLEFSETRMSRFAIDVSFYITICLLQWCIQVLIKEKIADPFRNFMDLCSIANISVLTMTHSLHGYYIHGRSVHGLADTDMLEMNTFLQRERDNLCGMRGLENGSELQTFCVNMPRVFRERLNQLTDALNRSLNTNIRKRGADKTTIRVESTTLAYNEFNQFLKNMIDHADPNCDYTITDGKLIEEIIGIELSDTSKIGTFTRDYSETGYSSAFLYGNEWTQILFEMLLFCVSDMLMQSRIFACILTFSISTIIRTVVKLFFTNNLVKSSLVDHRFLI